MNASGPKVKHPVDTAAVRALAEQLNAAAGNMAGDFVFATIDARNERIAHYAVPNGRDAIEPIIALIERIGSEPHMNIYFAGALFKSGSVTAYKGRTKENVLGVLCAVPDFDEKNKPASRRERLPVEPSAEVETSAGNFQAHYWFDKPYPGDEAEPVLYALAALTGADDCKSVEHLWRMPGTRNWPTADKIAAGRSPEPFPTRWSQGADNPSLGLAFTLDGLKAAILSRDPSAFDRAQKERAAEASFDWAIRYAGVKHPVSDDKLIGILSEDETGKRSSAAAKAVARLWFAGLTAQEILDALLAHTDLPAMEHYGTPPDEARIEADVKRLIVKRHEWEPSTSKEAFGDAAEGEPLDGVDGPPYAWGDLVGCMAWVNYRFAVVAYKGQTLIAHFTGDGDIRFTTVADFTRMMANRIFVMTDGTKTPPKTVEIPVSALWLKHPDRRQYLDPGVIFEPGRPEQKGAINLWRGFNIKPKAGDWSLMKAHIRNVVCAGNEGHYRWFLGWMALGVQELGRPIGAAIAMRGLPGSGKGIVARTYGELFGRHFQQIADDHQLTGRFNANLGMACCVFLDEAVWAGDKRGEAVLKALITEPVLSLEAKFRDPIMVKNCLRIMISSNNKWVVPVGIGDRRFAVFDVPDTYCDHKAHKGYWSALYHEIEHGGREAMLHELLAMDLSAFDVRDLPDTLAKTEQKLHSLRGTEGWLAQVLQMGAIGAAEWQAQGLEIGKAQAYEHYQDASRNRGEYRPDDVALWAKVVRKALGSSNVKEYRSRAQQQRRHLIFHPLDECRAAFERFLKAGRGTLRWEDQE